MKDAIAGVIPELKKAINVDPKENKEAKTHIRGACQTPVKKLRLQPECSFLMLGDGRVFSFLFDVLLCKDQTFPLHYTLILGQYLTGTLPVLKAA